MVVLVGNPEDGFSHNEAQIESAIFFPLLYSLLLKNLTIHLLIFTVMILSFRTVRSGQTVQTLIRLLLEEQSDLGLHCLLGAV